MDSLSLTLSLTPATWYNEVYESICDTIKEMCNTSKSKSQGKTTLQITRQGEGKETSYSVTA